MLMRTLMLATLLAACAPTDPERAVPDPRSSGLTMSIGGGLSTFYTTGPR